MADARMADARMARTNGGHAEERRRGGTHEKTGKRMTAVYRLHVPGFATRSTWGYDELSDLLIASVLPDSAGEREIPIEIVAVTIDQLLDRIDIATGGRNG